MPSSRPAVLAFEEPTRERVPALLHRIRVPVLAARLLHLQGSPALLALVSAAGGIGKSHMPPKCPQALRSLSIMRTLSHGPATINWTLKFQRDT